MIYRMYRFVRSGLELGFYVETTGPLSEPELDELKWLIAETFEPDNTRIKPTVTSQEIVEIGPRLSIETAFSSNAVAICQAMGLRQVRRIEHTHRYLQTRTKRPKVSLGIASIQLPKSIYLSGFRVLTPASRQRMSESSTSWVVGRQLSKK